MFVKEQLFRSAIVFFFNDTATTEIYTALNQEATQLISTV